ncbi:MAG: hypothetical protein NXH78_09765 [Hyphomonadaceae bacterium]|nr:hypothetical protein [Hyphomonadaceae bacterium]
MTAFAGDTLKAKSGIVAGVTLAHAVILAFVATMPLSSIKTEKVAVLNVELVERPSAPAPEVAAIDPPPAKPDPQSQAPLQITAPEPVQPETDVEHPDSNADGLDILTSLEPGMDDQPVPSASTGTGTSDSKTIDERQIAQALRLFSCQRLTRARDEDCPKPDPFAVAEALDARQQAALDPQQIPVFNQENAAEQFFSRQKQARHMFPGMDADMFGDTLPSGAYTASRIREGREPLWSEDMKRGFTKSD